MELIIGGAYQGKAEYARATLGITEIFACPEGALELDFSRPAIAHLELFALSRLRAGTSALKYFQEHRDQWGACVFLADDISCGVVPIDPELRAWREETGRLLNYLAGEARRVHRVFLGIGSVIK